MKHDPILAFAISAANRVYVYYDRIEAQALRRKIQPGWFLGVVIAHELAHVLLPDSEHAPAGVMAATLRPDPARAPAFMADEGRAMRARVLAEMTLAISARPCVSEQVCPASDGPDVDWPNEPL